MKNILLLLIIILCTIQVCSQNLVKNPDLEAYYHLPDLKYEYGDRYLYKDYFICKNWHRIKGTTPDYYHINARNKRYGIPYGKSGYHPVLSDSAYIGFVPFDPTGAIEAISGELKYRLTPGKKYEISFNYRYSGTSHYFLLDKLECFISHDIDWRDGKKTFAWTDYHNCISAETKANVVFKDSLNNDGQWHQQIGYFTAKGGEAYISFGIFYQNDKLFKIIKSYLGHNFELGDKDVLEERFLKKYRKELSFIHRNPNYTPIEREIYVEVSMETKKETTTNIFQERTAYYFIDNISVKDVDSEK
jgi:hypothetical protein